MKKLKVFNVEFDGIDKCGKDSVMKQMFAVVPNMYIPKARGLISQVAFAKMFNRDFMYEATTGYLENTLFVYLTVEEDDWNVRCKLTHEHELNKNRSDVEGEILYKKSVEAFDYAYDLIKKYAPIGIKNKNFMKFNTSQVTPINIVKAVAIRLEELNS